jgi:hypothetical protein
MKDAHLARRNCIFAAVMKPGYGCNHHCVESAMGKAEGDTTAYDLSRSRRRIAAAQWVRWAMQQWSAQDAGKDRIKPLDF